MPIFIKTERFKDKTLELSNNERKVFLLMHKEWVEDIRKSGPIKNLQNLMLDSGMKENELKSIDDEIRKVVNDSAEFAIKSEEPSSDELYTDVTIN